MKIKAQCKCGKRFRASARLVGHPIRCPFCREKFILVDPDVPDLPALPSDHDPLQLDGDIPPLESLTGLGTDLPKSSPTRLDELGPVNRRNGRRWFGGALSLGVLATAVIGVGLVALFVVSLVSPETVTLFGRRTNSIDLSYLPADTVMLQHVKVSELARSPVGDAILASHADLDATVELAQLMTGLTPSDVDSVTVGYRGPDQDDDSAAMVQWDFRNSIAFSGVVRTKVPYEIERVLEFAGETQRDEHEGRAYFTVRRRHRLPIAFETAIYFPNDTTIVFGTVAEVRAAIESKGKAARQAAFDDIKKNDTAVWILVESEDSGDVVHGRFAQVGDDMRIREAIVYGSPEAAASEHVTDDESVSNAAKMQQLFDRFAGGLITSSDPIGDGGESNELSGRFDIPFRVEGKKLVREMRLTRSDEFSVSFVLPLIRDLMPTPGESESVAR